MNVKPFLTYAREDIALILLVLSRANVLKVKLETRTPTSVMIGTNVKTKISVWMAVVLTQTVVIFVCATLDLSRVRIRSSVSMEDKGCVLRTDRRKDIVVIVYLCDCLRKIVVVVSTWVKDGVMIVPGAQNLRKVHSHFYVYQTYIFVVPEDHRRLCAGPVVPSTDPLSPIQRKNDTVGPDKKSQMEYPINECMLRPDICGEHQCVDTYSGYECICKPGYRKGHNQVCEG